MRVGQRLRRALIGMGISRTTFVAWATERLWVVALIRGARRSRAGRAVFGPLLRWLSSGPVTVQRGLARGLMVWVPGNAIEHAHCGLIVRGDLEVPVQEALRRTLAPGAVLYDVGANIGFFSLVGARLAGPEGRVYAFEPVAANAAAIRRNMELNGVGNVRVVERALSDAPGRARLQLVEDLSWSRLEATGAHPLTTEIVEVELATVDDLVATGEVPPPAAVKIDVEGSELEVLRGMEETIRGQGPAIVCELHGTGAAFAELMRSFGYAVQNLDGTGPVEASDALGHALALPST